jgi:GAF domain-containing protein
VGLIAVFHQEIRPFTDKQISLLQNFAAQAVIAIENARLLNELRESLDRQTATADVLRVISSSPGELEPVFKTMLENATRICEANFGVLQLRESGGFRIATTYNAPPPFVEGLARRELIFRPSPLHHLARVAASEQVVQVSDLAVDEAYQQRDPGAVRLVELAGARTVLCVPMLKEGELIGVIVIYRREVRPFTEKQIALVQNFAAQAVIAIENTRLLNELRQRTTDLSESLEQQTATSKVLEVISRSAFDLQAVFETVAESSVRLCGADRAMIFRFDGELLRMAVAFNAPQALKEFIEQNPIRPGRDSVTGRAPGQSRFPMSWLIRNIRTDRRTSRQSGHFSQYQYSKARTCSASLVFIT